MKWEKQTKQYNEPTNQGAGFLEDKHLAQQTRRKRERTQINKIINEQGSITVKKFRMF